MLEENYNVILFSLDRFKEWVGLLKGLPFIGEPAFAHARRILSYLRSEQILDNGPNPSYLSQFIDSLVVSEFSLKKEHRETFLKILINDIITSEHSQETFNKLV